MYIYVYIYVHIHEAVQVLLCVLLFGRKRSSGGRTNDRGGARQVLSSFAFQLSGSFRSPLLEYFRKSNCPRASLVAIFRKSGHVSLENLRGNNG